jgi:hypothetical protein
MIASDVRVDKHGQAVAGLQVTANLVPAAQVCDRDLEAPRYGIQ